MSALITLPTALHSEAGFGGAEAAIWDFGNKGNTVDNGVRFQRSIRRKLDLLSAKRPVFS